MPVSRRVFLQRMSAGAGCAAVLQVPLVGKVFASPEPQRNPIVPGAVILNSNENPYGPLPSAMRAMQAALTRGNRYPFADYDPLTQKVAAVNRVQPEQVLMGAGSTELLRICAEAFLGPGKNLIVGDPTFEALEQFAKQTGAETRRVPLTSEFAHDLEAMLARADNNTGLIYLCNPNNPTASITPAKDIDAFIGRLPAQATLLIDEAYHHFADGLPGYRSFMERAGDRIVVMRTFSKIYGMAGMRLGYSVASVTTTKKMLPFRLPISVNGIAAAGGIASLEDEAAMRSAAQRNATDRAEFVKQATARKVNFIPSFANFFMMKTGRPATEIISAFQQRNISIGRPFPPMTEYIRVSLGLPEENKMFW